MGIWDFIGATIESVKRNAPDATPLKNACRSSYTYGSASVTKIDQAVRIDAPHALGQWIPGDETKSKIGLYTTKFAKNAALYALSESYKLIPGGVAVSKIISKTLHDVESENLAAKKKLRLPEENKVDTPVQEHSTSGRRILIDRAEMQSRGDVHSVSEVLATYKTPEDAIRVFMMKDFFGNRFLDDLLVHKIARGKGEKKPE